MSDANKNEPITLGDLLDAQLEQRMSVAEGFASVATPSVSKRRRELAEKAVKDRQAREYQAAIEAEVKKAEDGRENPDE